VRFTPIERLIEQRRAEISHASVADAERIFEELYQYYFRGAGERSGGEARTLLDMIERKRRESSLRARNEISVPDEGGLAVNVFDGWWPRRQFDDGSG
jgi:hypothetical protein